uniref:Unannotated protein n=1 Tax=freshwater metagenome TaxID=449393 RepID=A0A6J5ZZZ6_9ZZZZ
MTNATSQQTWNRISDELRSAVGPALFDVWLAPLQLASIDGNRIVVEAPQASRAWVSDRFGEVLRSSAESVLGEQVDLQVSTAGSGAEASQAPAAAASRSGAINPKYCFEQFVIGNGNRLAHGAALAVAENPGTAYNPLFICGPPGVGKTHLLHSIADYAQRHGNGVRVQLTGAEAFANEFVAALRGGDINAFKARHREADIVLVDDVQFLMAKAKTEEEFFHTFNALREGGAQIVLTCDRPPRDLDRLEERLRDRFDSGLVADITPPDMPTRIAVLKSRASLDQVAIGDPAVLRLIAERVDHNLRALEGALIRVVAYASLSGKEISESLALEVLDGLFPKKANEAAQRSFSVEEIREQASRYFGVSVSELCSTSRVADVMWPRQVAMYLCREHTSASLSTIAGGFGGRGHTTALNACKRVEQRIVKDQRSREEVNGLAGELFKTPPATEDDRS